MRPPSTTPNPFLTGFLRGLSQPSRGALLGGLGFTAGLFLLGAGLLTERRVAEAPVGTWMTDGKDDYGRLTSLVLRREGADSAVPTVWILGASDTREMLLGESDLSRLLADSLGGPGRAASLCADGLLLEERAAVVDRLRPRTPGAIVLGINLNQFCRTSDDVALAVERYRLGFRSAVFDEEARLAGAPMPEPTGLYFFDNRLFLLRHTISPYRFFHPANHIEHRAKGNAERLRDPLRGRRMPRFSPEEFSRRTAVVSRIVDRNRLAGGPPIVLLEVPWLDAVEPRLGGPNRAAEFRVYREEVRKYAQRKQLVYLDPSASISLSRKDFSDYAHIGSDDARARFSAAFVRQLLPHLGPASSQ